MLGFLRSLSGRLTALSLLVASMVLASPADATPVVPYEPGTPADTFPEIAGHALPPLDSTTDATDRIDALSATTQALPASVTDFGAASADDYARMASEFYQQGLRSGLPAKLDPKTGVVRIYDRGTNTFGAFNPSGTTRTFYKPDPAAHGYASNWDYWLAQPGNAL
jgi:hypothetical protein